MKHGVESWLDSFTCCVTLGKLLSLSHTIEICRFVVRQICIFGVTWSQNGFALTLLTSLNVVQRWPVIIGLYCGTDARPGWFLGMEDRPTLPACQSLDLHSGYDLHSHCQCRGSWWLPLSCLHHFSFVLLALPAPSHVILSLGQLFASVSVLFFHLWASYFSSPVLGHLRCEMVTGRFCSQRHLFPLPSLSVSLPCLFPSGSHCT